MKTNPDVVTELANISYQQLELQGQPADHLEEFDDEPPDCQINWKPSVLYPVLADFQHYDKNDGAPGPLHVFYPSRREIEDGFDTSFLSGCGSYPLVIFLHGHCKGDSDIYKKWLHLPIALARSGYVVAAPRLPGIATGSSPWASNDLNYAIDIINWMQNEWEYHDYLVRSPGPAVIGHSYGAVLGSRLTLEVNASAYVSLGGGWHQFLTEGATILPKLDTTSLFAWGSSASEDEANLDKAGLWEKIKLPKHKLIFEQGAHWDYLDATQFACSGSTNQGPCELVPFLTADYAALFLSRYVPPEGAGIDGLIPPSLVPPVVKRTPLQEQLAAGHLEGISSLPMQGEKCQVCHVVEPPFLIDRSGEYQTPDAASLPTACMIPGLGAYNIAYRDSLGRLHELWRDAQGATGTTNLTAHAGAPTAVGNPFAYADTSRNTEILLFRDNGGTVRSLFWSNGPVGHDNLSGTAGAPTAAGDPVGYYDAAADNHHVIYRTLNGHLHELWWIGIAPVKYGGDLTALANAPTAVGQPSAFSGSGGGNIVVYRSQDGHIRDLFWTTGVVSHENLSGSAGAPKAAGDPFGYYTPHDDTHQIIYVGVDGHLWELYWQGITPVAGWNLTAAAGAPAPAPAGTPTAYYSAATHTKHVVYRSADNRLHELTWAPGGGIPLHVNLTAAYLAPLTAYQPTAFIFNGANTRHIALYGTDKHIYEIRL